VKVC